MFQMLFPVRQHALCVETFNGIMYTARGWQDLHSELPEFCVITPVPGRRSERRDSRDGVA